MNQVTIYLDADTERQMTAKAKPMRETLLPDTQRETV